MYKKFIKRLFDILLSIFILLICLPLLIIISLLIIIIDNNKIIYIQKRTGKDGNIFNIYKFSTFKNGSVTKFGKILRLLSLDEGITSIEDEIKFIRFTIENQIDHSIRVVAEGHSILNRRINAMEEKTSNVEELIIRCDVLEMKIKEMMRQSAV